MDMGGLNWFLVDVVGVVILLAALLWVVMRSRSKGKSTSSRKTEQATRELYEEEDRVLKQEER